MRDYCLTLPSSDLRGLSGLPVSSCLRQAYLMISGALASPSPGQGRRGTSSHPTSLPPAQCSGPSNPMPMAVGARVGLSPIARGQIYVRYLNCGFRHAFLIENLSMPCIVCGGTGGCPSPPPSAWIHTAHLKHGFRHASPIENAQFPIFRAVVEECAKSGTHLNRSPSLSK